MSATTAHYHVIIAGTDLPGLILGALCAKRGYRVAVLGHGGHPVVYEHAGHVMCRRVPVFYGLGSPAVRRVFEQLSMALELRNMPRQLEPGFQVVLPTGRMDMTADEQRLRAEFEREMPGETGRIGAFYRRVAEIDARVEEVLELGLRLPPQGLRARRFSRHHQRCRCGHGRRLCGCRRCATERPAHSGDGRLKR